jgi:hypothetical protein
MKIQLFFLVQPQRKSFSLLQTQRAQHNIEQCFQRQRANAQPSATSDLSSDGSFLHSGLCHICSSKPACCCQQMKVPLPHLHLPLVWILLPQATGSKAALSF